MTLALMLAIVASCRDAHAQVASEYQVKAAFLVNFFKFVEWPADAFASDSAPLVLLVVGDDPFGSWLDEATRGKKVGGHPLVVHRIGVKEAMVPAHLVFVSRSARPHLADILGRTYAPGALLVSDIDGFCGNGGAITFVIDEDRVRFEINIASASRQRLRISTKLLSLATVVHGNSR